MATKLILVEELKVGDRFKDTTPDSNGGEYVVSYKGAEMTEAHPVWDIDGEAVVQFFALEVVEIEGN